MKKPVLFISIIIGFLLLTSQGYSTEPNKAQWAPLKGYQGNNEPYYPVGPNKIRFSMGFAFPKNWRNELEIDEIAKGMAEHHSRCHVARVWRWEILPEDSPAVLILTWYNLANHEFGWSAIKNTDDHWYVSSKYQSWITQKDYTPSENMWFNWVSNGTKISIFFRNPKNENGWTPDDIWYQFNYF